MGVEKGGLLGGLCVFIGFILFLFLIMFFLVFSVY